MRSKALAGEWANLPAHSGFSLRSLTPRSLVDPAGEVFVCLKRPALHGGAYAVARFLAPDRPSLWYALMAAFRVESPSVAFLVRLPITSLPNPSTNAS